MADFRQPIQPTNDPNYLGYSQDIKPGKDLQPEGVQPLQILPTGVRHVDQSGAIAGQGLANMISGVGNTLDFVGKAVDQVVKKQIEEGLYRDIDNTRGGYEAGLLDVLGSPAALRSRAASTPMSVDIPEDLAGLSGDVSTLQAAYRGKAITFSHYYGKLNEIAKNYRTQWPGQRAYIDSTIGRITGVDPANARIRALAADVNQATAALGSQRNNWLTKSVVNMIEKRVEMGDDEAPIMINYVLNGGDPKEAYKWVQSRNATKYKYTTKKEEADLAQLSREERKLEDTQTLDSFLTTESSQRFNTITTVGGWTPQKVSQWLNEINTGQRAMPEGKEALAMSAYIRSQQKAFENAALKQAADSNWFNTVGDATVKAKIASHSEVFNNVADLIENKQYGLAYGRMNYNKAQAEDDKAVLSELLPEMRVISAANDAGGPHVANQVYSQAMGKGFSSKLTAVVQNQLLTMSGQPEILTKGPTPLKEMIEFQQRKAIGTPKSYQALVDHINRIANPDTTDEEAKNIAASAFSPGNKGFLAMPWTDKDGNDASMKIFAQMTTTQIADRMEKIGGQTWANYKDWVEHEFGKNIFNKELSNLKDVMVTPGIEIGWSPGSSRPLRLIMKGRDVTEAMLPGGRSPREPEYFAKQYQPMINKLNSGLSRIADIAKREKDMDVEAYLVRQLGRDLDLTKVQSLPQHIVKSFIGYREQLKREEEAQKKRESLD